MPVKFYNDFRCSVNFVLHLPVKFYNDFRKKNYFHFYLAVLNILFILVVSNFKIKKHV